MKSSFISFILLILALASYKLLLSVENELDYEDKQEETKVIATLYNASGSLYDKNDSLQYDIASKQVREYSNEYGTEFDFVDVKSYDNNLLSWIGKADFATLSGDKTEIMLEKDVRFVQAPNSENAIDLTGNVIYYDAKERKAFSYEPVLIKDDIIKQNNNNFSLDIDTGKVTFDSGVKANYENKLRDEK